MANGGGNIETCSSRSELTDKKKHYVVVELALSISNPNEEWQFGHKLPFLALFPSLEY